MIASRGGRADRREPALPATYVTFPAGLAESGGKSLRRYAPLVARLLLLSPRVSSAEWQALTPAEPPEGNPLCGLMPYQAPGQPHNAISLL